MSGMTIICTAMLVGLLAIVIMLIVVCVRWEKRHPEDVQPWEDITEEGVEKDASTDS